MDAICQCFKEHGSPENSENDDEQAEKWALISQQMQHEKQFNRSMRSRSQDMDDEKVNEYFQNDDNQAFKIQSSDEENMENVDDDDDDDDGNESEISDGMSSLPSLTSDTSRTYAIMEIKPKYDPLYEDTPSTFTPHRNAFTPSTFINSITTSNDSTDPFTWNDHDNATLHHEDSLMSNTTTPYGSCTNCMNLEHIQKQLEIQIQTIRDRNNELEDQVVDAQTNEANTKRLYDELNEDLDRIQNKYDALLKISEGNKVKYDEILQQTRNKLEDEIQNIEKNYQDIVREKNTLELNINETHDKLEKTESDLMSAHNTVSTLHVQKARVAEDLKMEQSKMENLKKEYEEKMDTFETDKKAFLETIKRQKQKAVTDKENNELTTNILKDQIKSLHSEIADIEEEKKALQESIALYDKQMEAEQLMDTASLDLILEENEGSENEDDDNQIILEDEETEAFMIGIAYDEPSFMKRHSKSNNMSISELEPATFSRLGLSNHASEDEDAVYINYNSMKLSAANSSPGLFLPSPIIRALTPPMDAYDLSEDSPEKKEDSLKELRKLYISTRGVRSASDVLRVSPSDRRTPSPSAHKHSNSTSTHLHINVWKDRYSQLKSESTLNAKQMAQNDIELNSLRDKVKSLQDMITEYVHRTETLQSDLETLQQSYVDLHSNELKSRKQYETELNEIQRELNNARDEIATLSTENERYLQYKGKMVKEYKKKDKLHTKQLKFNEELMNEIFDLNNEVKQLTDINMEMKSRLDSVIASNGESGDKYDIVKRKLSKAEKERKDEQKRSTRLKNKVSALNQEVLSLNQTISGLESLFQEHSYLLRTKNKRIKHLGKQREVQQQSIHKLSSKLKKRHRHMKGFLAAEEDSFKKSHTAKDKRLSMLRETNRKLISKIEETDKKLMGVNTAARDLKNKLKDERENRRMDKKALEVGMSKLTAQYNQIVTEKQEIEYERDNAMKRNTELRQDMERNNRKIKSTIQSIVDIERDYGDVLMWLNSMDIKDDALHQFVDRCRNTFVNTNKLTNKLTTQLIEGCDRAIGVYYNSVSYFKVFIDACLGIKDRFKNIEKTYTQLEFHSYELYQSALCSIYNIGGSSSAASNVLMIKRESVNVSRSTRRMLNPKNKDVIPKIPLIAKDLIRKPIQSETVKVPMEAYNQIYDLLSKHIQDALRDLRKVTVSYSTPLDMSLYNEEIDDEKASKMEFDDEAQINWNRLSLDPSTERLYPGLKESNDKRFDQIMSQVASSTKQFRREQTRNLMQLDGAWHQYHIAVGPNTDLSPRLSSRYIPDASDMTINENMESKEENNKFYLSPLTLKVSSQGMHSKRYSIV